MQITKEQKRLLIVLSAVVLFAVIDFTINSEQYLGYYLDDGPAPVSVNPVDDSKEKAIPKYIPVLNYKKGWGKDPFFDVSVKKIKKRSASKKVEPILHLQAISYSGENSVVMINNMAVRVGENIEGYRVLKIEPQKVTLTKDGDIKTITLGQF
ncbi:MAG: hypothetical protein AB7T22_03400 [Calditrichaceae bacterium]